MTGALARSVLWPDTGTLVLAAVTLALVLLVAVVGVRLVRTPWTPSRRETGEWGALLGAPHVDRLDTPPRPMVIPAPPRVRSRHAAPRRPVRR